MGGNSHTASFLSRVSALLETAFLLWLLTQIPYDLLREERIRAFGEAESTAWVLKRLPHHSEENAVHHLLVRYRGPDGREREAAIPVSRDFWISSVPGSGVAGFVARADPSLYRITGQIEEPFRVWLRNALGNTPQ